MRDDEPLMSAELCEMREDLRRFHHRILNSTIAQEEVVKKTVGVISRGMGEAWHGLGTLMDLVKKQEEAPPEPRVEEFLIELLVPESDSKFVSLEVSSEIIRLAMQTRILIEEDPIRGVLKLHPNLRVPTSE